MRSAGGIVNGLIKTTMNYSSFGGSKQHSHATVRCLVMVFMEIAGKFKLRMPTELMNNQNKGFSVQCNYHTHTKRKLNMHKSYNVCFKITLK
jgi:hypothetical protein